MGEIEDIADEQSISWDWLIDGFGDEERKHIRPSEDAQKDEFNTVGINSRFLSCFEGFSKNDIATSMNVSRDFVNAWITFRKQVPWETLHRIVLSNNISWEWLLEGRDPKYRS